MATEGARLPRALRPFADGRYRLLTVALTMSLFGGGVWLVAMVAAVFEFGGSPVDLSIIATGNAVGMIVAVLVGGALADRFRQQRLLLWVEVGRTAVIAVVIALAATGLLQLWELTAASVLLGLLEGIFYPSYSALLPRILHGDQLLAANGVEGMLRPLAHDALGPAIGGIVIAAWHPAGAFWLIGASQLVAILCLLALRGVLDRPERPEDAHPNPVVALFKDIGSGMGYVLKTRWLVWTLIYACVVVLLMLGPIEVLIPFAVRDQTGGGTIEYSFVLTAFGVGAAVGSLITASLRMPRRYLTWMNLLWVVGLVPLAVIGFVDQLWIMIAAAAAVGGLTQSAGVLWGTILQRRVPTHLLGRVSSLDFFVSLALMPVSMALAGPIGEAVGLTPVFLVAALLPVPIGIAALLIGRMPRDEIEHPLSDAPPDAPADSYLDPRLERLPESGPPAQAPHNDP